MISGRAAFFACVAFVLFVACYILIKLVFWLFVSELEDKPRVDVEQPAIMRPYDRSLFGNWADYDGDCLNTREEVLLEESLQEVRFGSSGCRIEAGLWIDVYSGDTITQASEVDIDHLVSLNYAWHAGAENWPEAELTAFANDTENLIITTAEINRGKGSASPLDWLPPNALFHCGYVERFLKISQKYDLFLSEQSASRVVEIQSDICN